MFVNIPKFFSFLFTASDTGTRAGEPVSERERGGETRRIYYTNPRLRSTRVVLIEIDVNKLVPVSTFGPTER
jgi:hypothetical protein